MYIVYTTDSYHSCASRGFRGVFDTKEEAIGAITEGTEVITGEMLSDDDLFNLQNIDQTQGHQGLYEWVIEKVPLNEIV